MSIYASWPAPKDDHEDACVYWTTLGDDLGGAPCDCGLPDAPIVYQGSHVVPTEADARGGWIDIASIPRHITTGRDEDDGWLPFLRFGVNNETVVLDRRGVELVHRSLTEWLAGLEAS